MSKVYKVIRRITEFGVEYVRAEDEWDAEDWAESIDCDEILETDTEVREVSDEELKDVPERRIFDITGDSDDDA